MNKLNSYDENIPISRYINEHYNPANVKKEIFNYQKILTRQELKILSYMSIGMSAKEIARNLYISHRTVEKHLENIRSKFSCKSNLQLLHKLTMDFNKFIMLDSDLLSMTIANDAYSYGQIHLIIKMLEKKFSGNVTEEYLSKLKNVNSKVLEKFAGSILTANSIEDVFG